MCAQTYCANHFAGPLVTNSHNYWPITQTFLPCVGVGSVFIAVHICALHFSHGHDASSMITSFSPLLIRFYILV